MKLPSWREVVLVIITAIGVALALGIYSARGAVLSDVIAEEEAFFSVTGILRMLFTLVVGTIVGMGSWWWQTRSTRIRDEAREKEKKQLEKDLLAVTEEKARIAEEQKELSQRVSASETLLGTVREQLGLLQREASPLFEAAKIRLIASLTHPHKEFKVPDDLLKLALGPDGYITPELAVLLKERETSTHPEVTPDEKLAAAILPAVVELAAKEAKVIGPLTTQLVTTPSEARPKE